MKKYIWVTYVGMQVHHHPGNWTEPDTFDPVGAYIGHNGPQKASFSASHACLALRVYVRRFTSMSTTLSYISSTFARVGGDHLQDRWAVPHAELASAKASPSKLPEAAQDDTVDAQAAAKRFLPFSTGRNPHDTSPLVQMCAPGFWISIRCSPCDRQMRQGLPLSQIV